MRIILSFTIIFSIMYASTAQPVELQKAIEKVEQHLKTLNISIEQYKLITAQNVYLLGCKGQYIGAEKWHLTYMPKNNLPSLEQPLVGVGGQLFVLYNSDTQQFTVTYGE